MEILITGTNLLIAGLIIIVPFLLLLYTRRFKIIKALIFYFIVGLLVQGVLVFIFAWWSYESDLILLNHYGYNIDGMNQAEFYGNILPENIEQVKNIETSILGIGWPLKAIFAFMTIIPYLIIVYIGKIVIGWMKNKKKEA